GEAEQGLRLQPVPPEDAMVDHARRHQEAVLEAWQEQRVAPDQAAGDQTRHRTLMGGTAPVEPADEAWQKLGHAAEGYQADRGKRIGTADQAKIDESQKDDEDDAGAPRAEDEGAHAPRIRIRQRRKAQ